ncbi:hypothetical protein AAMO2058_001083000 [Amorphochlora amoebiformis]
MSAERVGEDDVAGLPRMMSTYDLTLDDFQHAFDPKIFIRKLTSPIFGFDEEVKKIADSNGNFHPKPYGVLFQSAIEQLYSLRRKVDEDIRVLISDTKMAEAEHKAQLKELNNKFHWIRTEFQHLEQRISKVSHTAVRTGQQLEAKDLIRRKTDDSKILIRQFLEFNTGNPKKLDSVFTDDKRLQEAALQIQKLQKISRELQGAKTETAHSLIQSTGDLIERKLLDRFSDQSAATNLDKMKELARTLCKFESQKLIDQYVERVMEKMPDPEKELKGLAGIPPSVFSDKCKQFYDAMLRECRQSFTVIGKVFPNPYVVALRILKNLFGDRIKTFINLSVGQSQSTGDYLVVLEDAHYQTEKAAGHLASLKSDLLDASLNHQMHTTALGRLRASLSPSSRDSNPNPALDSVNTRLTGIGAEVSVGGVGVGVAGIGGVGAGVGVGGSVRGEEFKFKENVEALFNPFRADYLEKEVAHLRQHCQTIIAQATNLDEKQREDLDDKSLFGRRKKGAKGSRALKRWVLECLDAPAVAGSPPSPIHSAHGSGSPKNNSAFQKRRAILGGGGESSVVSRVLNHLSAGLERSDRLAEDVPLCCNRLASEAWAFLIESYIKVALQLADQVLPDDDSRDEPDTRFFFRATGAVNRIIRKMSRHYRIKILPRLESDPNMKSRALVANKEALASLEKRLLGGIRLCLNAVVKYAERLLTKQQRPADFKPKDEMVCFECTDACHMVSGFIAVQAEAAVESLEGRNLDAYLAELGRQFHALVLSHLRKFSVSPLGAMVVAQDVKRFQDVVSAFHIEEVSRLFSVLRDMSTLLLLPVEQLGMVVQQRLSSVPKDELHDFLRSRADYAKQRIQILSLLNI